MQAASGCGLRYPPGVPSHPRPHDPSQLPPRGSARSHTCPGIPRGTGPRFWITGERSDGKYIDVEGAGILFLAWRCLHAETVRARTKSEHLKLKHAYARVVLMSISRLKAQGQKWYRWYSRTRGISEHKVKEFPKRYRKRRLMTTTATADYEISDVLLQEYDSVKQDRI